jgi:hypothetical protein
MSEDLTRRLVDLVSEMRADVATDEARRALADITARLEGPLRLAIAGKVKAGKSTLLNALLGEELAPTNAEECTKIVTWYRHSHRPYARLFPIQGRPAERPYARKDGALDVDLGGLPAHKVDHLEIGWPTDKLLHLTVVDTPGIASISTDVSARTHRVLSSDQGRLPVTDAVLYLLRHTHSSDVHFLESFHHDELAHGTPMNSVGVLSRADEIGSCRRDAMTVAARVAERYVHEPRLHRLCPLVVPVDGLLGFAGATLRESEFAALTAIAQSPRIDRDELLLTADRFVGSATSIPVSPEDRSRLLERLGLFGVRRSEQAIRDGLTSANALSSHLVELSGLNRLRSVVLFQFEQRSRILKARSAVQALEELLRGGGVDNAAGWAGRLEEIAASAHEFDEVRLLADLRSGTVDIADDQAATLDRLLGGSGHDAALRLGIGEEASPEDIRTAASAGLSSWRALAEHPLSSRSLRLAAETATRTLEGLLADVVRHGDRSPPLR